MSAMDADGRPGFRLSLVAAFGLLTLAAAVAVFIASAGAEEGVEIACVFHEEPTFFEDDGHRSYPTRMVLEQPAIREDGTRYRWTDVAAYHNTWNSARTEVYFFVGAAVLHEFGHILGLDDLYGSLYGELFSHYLMGESGTHTTVPSGDQNYLEQVYRNHGGTAHD